MQPLRKCPVVSVGDNRHLFAAGRQWPLCLVLHNLQPESVTSLRPPSPPNNPALSQDPHHVEKVHGLSICDVKPPDGRLNKPDEVINVCWSGHNPTDAGMFKNSSLFCCPH